ncbi:MAG: 50S ribosomal protein L10, partial [Candidatus Thioglobus sp.]
MALNLEAKKVVVKQVNALAKSSIAVGVAEYRGLTVEQMTNLRASAMDASVSLRVVKNSLAKRALVDTECECVMPVLSGPVILGFSQEDPGAVA